MIDIKGKLPSKYLLKLAKRNSIPVEFYLCSNHYEWLIKISDSDYHSKCKSCK